MALGNRWNWLQVEATGEPTSHIEEYQLCASSTARSPSPREQRSLCKKKKVSSAQTTDRELRLTVKPAVLIRYGSRYCSCKAYPFKCFRVHILVYCLAVMINFVTRLHCWKWAQEKTEWLTCINMHVRLDRLSQQRSERLWLQYTGYVVMVMWLCILLGLSLLHYIVSACLLTYSKAECRILCL